MNKPTPGPWLIEYAETRMRWPVIYVEDEAWDGGRREIASLSSHVAKRTKADQWRKTKDAEESEANARLIAAAPDLLAALVLAEAAMNRMGDVLNEMDVVDEDDVENATPAFEAVRAAIRKATGAA